jgi:hypothetical protein
MIDFAKSPAGSHYELGSDEAIPWKRLVTAGGIAALITMTDFSIIYGQVNNQ